MFKMSLHVMPGEYEYEKDLILPSSFFPRENMDQVKTFNMVEGDVAVVTYPKAGTTWMQEILYQIHTGADVDSEDSKRGINLRVPTMEIIQKHFPGHPSGVTVLEGFSSPRLMKSHCPAWFFSEHLRAGKGKFVVVMRNIKDSLVSYFHFYTAATMYQFEKGTWEEFFELFKAKRLSHGDWLNTNLSWWQHRDTRNVLILKYEYMKKQPKAEILKLTRFLGMTLSADQVDRIVHHTSFDILKDNTAVTKSLTTEFYNPNCSLTTIRKGIVGDWQEYFTPEQNDYVQKYYIEEAEKHGLVFEYK